MTNMEIWEYGKVVVEYNRKLERECSDGFIPTQYKLVRSEYGKMAALFRIEYPQTPFDRYDMPEQTIVHEWCYESFVDKYDECFNGEKEDFDIEAYFARIELKKKMNADGSCRKCGAQDCMPCECR